MRNSGALLQTSASRTSPDARKFAEIVYKKCGIHTHTNLQRGTVSLTFLVFFGFLEKKKAVLLYFGMVKDNAAGLTKGEATRQGEAPRLASQS